ncbi:hypothetical protein cypCar_00028348 [Cyprinus carpio]|nr:hypothetical protein cypCar_00028348 [Cyprinus carpio]
MNEEKNATLESQQEEKVEDHAGREIITKTDKGLSDGTAAGPEKMLQVETQDKPSAQGEVKLRPKDRLSPDDAKQTAQGRLEEQRSAAPGPMDDEDFFCLLLKVQGGRMDEQRTELKPVH